MAKRCRFQVSVSDLEVRCTIYEEVVANLSLARVIDFHALLGGRDIDMAVEMHRDK